MLNAIHLDFSSINELSGIEGLSTSNPYHHMTVSDHTLDVVEKVKETQYYQQTDVRTKDILELAAYLHDIGKGPKSKWRDEIQPPYPDHPADAIPMLARIFTKDLEEISEDEIRIISLIVVYHDIIGEYLSKGRRIDEFLPLIVCEKDYDMLACLSEADMKSIDYLWWVEYKAKERELKTRFIPHE